MGVEFECVNITPIEVKLKSTGLVPENFCSFTIYIFLSISTLN